MTSIKINFELVYMTNYIEKRLLQRGSEIIGIYDNHDVNTYVVCIWTMSLIWAKSLQFVFRIYVCSDWKYVKSDKWIIFDTFRSKSINM